MDILQKYNEENPEASRQISRWESSEECSFLACMVMKWSAGKIQNESQANVVLVIFSVVILGMAFIITINPFGNRQPIPPGVINLPGQPPRLGPTITPEL